MTSGWCLTTGQCGNCPSEWWNWEVMVKCDHDCHKDAAAPSSGGWDK